MKKTKKRKWPWITLAIIVVLVAAFLIISNNFRSQMAQVRYNTYTVSTGTVEVSITGSGQLEPVETENIDLPDGLKVQDVFVKAGDVVEAGQSLAVFDLDSLQDQAASLSDELTSLDRQLTQLTRSKTTEYVYAPVKGRIKYLPVAVGDDVTSSIAEHGALALLSTDGLMRVDLQTDTTLELYSEVMVRWDGHKEEGEVVAPTENGYLITLTDNGTPYGETAEIYDGDTLIGSGVIEINKPVAVYANGGTISKVRYKENAKVSANAKLFTLNNEPLSNAYQQTYSQRQDLAEQLQAVIAYMNDPTIVALQEGTISEVRIEKNGITGNGTDADADAASSTGGKSTSFVMNISGALTMTIDVDELDIGSVRLGQTATISLDAISSEMFEATVTRISYLGDIQGSITTYAVELTLKSDPRFLTGMNGNATIMVDRADDALLIPIEAINEDETGVYVYVSESGVSDGSDRLRVDITTGLSDGEYAEVKSGLSQGNVLLYITASSVESMFPGMTSGGMGMPNGVGGFGNRGGENDD